MYAGSALHLQMHTYVLLSLHVRMCHADPEEGPTWLGSVRAFFIPIQVGQDHCHIGEEVSCAWGLAC